MGFYLRIQRLMSIFAPKTIRLLGRDGYFFIL